jgi:hypothetical protein
VTNAVDPPPERIDMTKYLRASGAADYLRSKYGFGAKRTLDKLRVIGGGPVYTPCGRIILYAPEDLDAWAEAKLGPPRRSTSDAAPLRGTASTASPRLGTFDESSRRGRGDANNDDVSEDDAEATN